MRRQTCMMVAVLASSLLTGCRLCRVQALVGGQSLSDDRWHSLYVKRRANVVQLGVDSTLQSTGELRMVVLVASL